MKKQEELANVVTHAFGILLSIIGFLILLNNEQQSGWNTIGVVVYGICLITLYIGSTVYHLVKNEKWKKRFQVIDHSVIYLKIAGTYTPFGLITLKDHFGLQLLSLVWILALIGIIFKIFFSDRYILFSTAVYLLMGWMAIAALEPLWNELTSYGFWFLLTGGLLYTAGVIFFHWERLPFNHAIWHLFVLGGSTMHYLVILMYVI